MAHTMYNSGFNSVELDPQILNSLKLKQQLEELQKKTISNQQKAQLDRKVKRMTMSDYFNNKKIYDYSTIKKPPLNIESGWTTKVQGTSV